MKNSIFFLLVSIIIRGVISSCKKDPANNNPAQDRIAIRSFLNLNPNRASGYDTNTKYYFDYDALKRLSFASEEYFNDNTNKPLYRQEIKFYYQNQDTLPYKLTMVLNDFSIASTNRFYDTAYLTYRNGFVVKDSILTAYNSFPFATDVVEFSGTNPYSIHVKRISPGSVISKTRKSIPEWQNGNLMHELDSGSYLGGPTIAYTNNRFQYDNYKNPLRKVLLRFPGYHFHRETNLTSLGLHKLAYFPPSVNNVTRREYDNGGGPTIFEWTYTYNSDGFPITAVATVNNVTSNYFYNYIEL